MRPFLTVWWAVAALVNLGAALGQLTLHRYYGGSASGLLFVMSVLLFVRSVIKQRATP